MSGHIRVERYRETRGFCLTGGGPRARFSSNLRATLLILSFQLLFLACSKQRSDLDPGRTRAPQAREKSVVDAAQKQNRELKEEQPEAVAPPKRIFARRFVVAIRETPSKEAYRIGYLRAGAVLMATAAKPVGRDRCRRGWYQLETGGFVCSGSDVTPFYGRRLPERRATQPDREARLPYHYGCSVRSNTPIYRRLPTDEEAAVHEGYRIPGRQPETDVAESAVAIGRPDAAVLPGANAAQKRGRSVESTETALDESNPTAQLPRLAGEPGSGVQSNSQTQVDAGPPTLESLMGEKNSVVTRRMVKGFYTSLDREMRSGRRKYWRTQANGFIPFGFLREVKGSAFHGARLAGFSPEKIDRAPVDSKSNKDDNTPSDQRAQHTESSNTKTTQPIPEPVADLPSEKQIHDAQSWTLPVGFLLSSKTWAYTRTERGGVKRAEKPGYHYSFKIVGEEEIRRRRYYLSADGRYFRTKYVTRIDAQEPPKEIGEGEKWIDVDLERQTLVAYLGNQPVYATLISSGRVKQRGHPQKDFSTPTGSFRILSKHVTHTMDGDHEVDGPYSIEDVPYVMYFQLAYALHSAFWHNSFGRPRSHGCINMSPIDARWLFDWISPEMPRKWHSVYPKKERPGTRLYIRGETPVR